MTNEKKMKIIKTVCWLGAIADGFWAVALVDPRLYGIITSNADLDFTLPFRLTMGIGASLMAGWSALLLWAAKNPIDRRFVMLLTFCPVIVGLFIVSIAGIKGGNTANFWLVGKLTLLGLGMTASFHLANGMAKETGQGARR